jgi:hypothetical protein
MHANTQKKVCYKQAQIVYEFFAVPIHESTPTPPNRKRQMPKGSLCSSSFLRFCAAAEVKALKP